MPPIIGAIAAAALSPGIVGALTQMAVGLVSSAVLSAILPKPKSRRPAFSNVARGRQDQIRQAITPHRTIYGEVLVAGTIVYAESYSKDTANQNERLSLIIVFAGHEIESVEKWYFNDTELTLSGNEVQGVYTGFAQIFPHLGASGQAADSGLNADSTNWTAEHRLRGRAYVHVRLKYNADVFADGIPKVRALIRGRKVLDTRTSPDTTAWSQNPALCIRDYLSTRLGFTTAEIDDTTFEAAANVCDEDVTLAGSPAATEKRYTCNGTIEDNERPVDVLQSVLSSMAGTLTNVGGVWKLYAGASAASSITLDESDLRGPIVVKPRLPRREIFNAVKPVFVDSAQDYQPVDAPPLTNTSYETQDGGDQIWKNLELPFTMSNATAQRLGKIELERARNQITVEFPAKPNALRLQVWDVVSVTNSRFGWSAKDFRVIGLKIRQDLGVDLTLREEAAAMWAWSAEESTPATPPALSVPDPGTVQPPTGVQVVSGGAETIVNADGTTHTRAKVSWTAAADQFVTEYQVEFKRSADSTWTSAPPVPIPETTVYIAPVEPGVNYDVRVRARTGRDKTSVWATVIDSPITTDTSAPGSVTDVTLTGQIAELRVQWTNPTDKDFHHAEVFLRTDSNTPADTDRVHTQVGGRGKEQDINLTGLAFPQQFWVHFKTVDASLNRQAAFTGPFTASTRAILASDIQDGIINTAKFASGIEPVSIVSALPAAAGYTGPKTVFLTTDKKLYKFNDSASPAVWDAVANTTDLTGTIGTTQIADDAITTPKIAANQVTAAEIAANTITASQIAANTIEAGQIKAATITSAEIAANEIKASNMAADAITAANGAIANLAVVNAKIANLTIATGKVANNAITKAAANTDTGGANPQANVSVTVTAGTVFIIWTGEVSAIPTHSASYPTTSVYTAGSTTGLLKRDTTVIVASQTLLQTPKAGGTVFATAAMSVSETPGAGTYNYKMEGTAATRIGDNAILVLELKK